ncbi:MAG: hypothetical protein PVJ98_02920 [Akkermansiaceae bacterium]|jgi:hypothetical protein
MFEDLEDLLAEMPGEDASEAEIESFMAKVAERPGGMEWIREWAEAIAGNGGAARLEGDPLPLLASPARFVFRIELLETKPPVWRRISAPADLSFGHLHEMIREVFGWKSKENYWFEVLEEGRVEVSFGPGEEHYNDDECLVMDLFQESVGEFFYLTGQEGKWRHRVVVEDFVGEGLAGTSTEKGVHLHDGEGETTGLDSDE